MAEQKQSRKEPMKAKKEIASIIRMSGKDVNGALSIERAMSEVKGIGRNLAHALSYAIRTKLEIDPATPVGTLSDEQLAKVEGVIEDPMKYGIPRYMINRLKDFETGKDLHVTGNDLIFNIRQDITRETALRTWKGHRHQYGQKVRGQRTRSTGRTGATIGVQKKAAAPKPGTAAAAAKK